MKARRHQTLKIALVQFRAEAGNVSENIKRMKSFISQYRDEADLIIFPEYSVTGYLKDSSYYDAALKTTDDGFEELVASTKDVAVAFGFVEETESFNFYNSLAFIKNKELIHVHRKIYLINYGVFEERKHFSAGPSYKCWDIDQLRLAPFICGDAWNPALVHLAAADRAHVFLFPACSPEEGLGGRLSTFDSWQRLNRFYATMYGAYVVFVNRVGEEGGLHFWGKSEVIDPFGRVVVSSQDAEEEVLMAEVDLSLSREARTILHTIRDEDLNFIKRRLENVISKNYI